MSCRVESQSLAVVSASFLIRHTNMCARVYVCTYLRARVRINFNSICLITGQFRGLAGSHQAGTLRSLLPSANTTRVCVCVGVLTRARSRV